MSEHWGSYSSLSSHRACPQKWNYSYVQRLEKVDPDDVKVEMEFGSWWHMLRAAHAIARGRVHDSLQQMPERLSSSDSGPVLEGEDLAKVVPVDVLSLATLWWREQDEMTKSQWVERLGEGLPDRLDHLNQRWIAQWSDDLETERPLAVELKWRRELPILDGPDGKAIDPATVLVGYVDEVYLDTRRNMVVVRDAKSSKSLSTQTTADDMMDSQLQLYAWGASPTVSSWGKGRISAVAYDRVCSVKPNPPQLTKSGRLAQRLGKPSVGSCDLHTYMEWTRGPDGLGVPFDGLAKDGSGAGFYHAEEAIIERLSSPSAISTWFQRTLTPLNTNIIRTHLRAAVDTAVDAAMTRARIEVSGEAGRNLTSGCRWCDFAGLCRAQMVGGATGDYLLSDYKLRVRS